MLASPTAERANFERPAIVIVNAGANQRIGPHRFYLEMAREWAELGFYVLRLDLSVMNVSYSQRAIDDVRAAMTFLSIRLAVNRFIIAGLGSGADIAFQTGFQEPRVAGAVMLNPRTFFMGDEVKVTHGLRETLGKAYRITKTLLATSRRPRLVPEYDTTTADKSVPACLRILAARAVDTLLVVSEHNPGVAYLDLHFKKDMRALEKSNRFQRINVKNADHTFTSLQVQRQVLDAISAHLTARHATGHCLDHRSQA